MMTGTLINVTQKKVLARKVRYCDRFLSRLKGLLGTQKLDLDEACWLIPCNMVHTFGMHYAIDVVFLNKKNDVVSVVQNLKPNCFSPFVPTAHSVVEFSSGTQQKTQPGEQLAWEDSSQ